MRSSSLPSLGSLALLAILTAILVNGGCESGDEPAGNAGSGDRVEVEVTRVVDGDTVEVGLDGVTEDVRYIGVDTPESVKPGAPVECFGLEASDFNARLVEGEAVELVFDRERRDDYGRLLAYVYVDDLFVNAELVRRGYATTLTIEPNDRFAERLARLEQRAGAAGRGLWSACGP